MKEARQLNQLADNSIFVDNEAVAEEILQPLFCIGRFSRIVSK